MKQILFILTCCLVLILSSCNNHNTFTNFKYGELEVENLNYYIAPEPGAPIVIFVHGGGWVCCSKDDADNLDCTRIFHEAGYAVVSMDYVLAPDENYEGFPHQIENVACVIAWTKNNADLINGDPDKIVLVGESAGAHMVALMGLYNPASLCEGCNWEAPLDVHGVITWSGPFYWGEEFLEPEDDEESVIIQMLGDRDSLNLWLSQPINHLNGSTNTHFMIMHGAEDPVVPVEQSKTFYDSLIAAGYVAEKAIIEGHGHDFIEKARPDNAIFIPTLDFLYRLFNQ